MPGATSGYSLPFPVGGDALGDGDNEIQGLAEAVEAALPDVIVKSANETVVSSTTYQDDDDLSFTVEANTTYLVDFLFLWESAAAASGIKLRWDLPADAVAHGWSVKMEDENYTEPWSMNGVEVAPHGWLIQVCGVGLGLAWEPARFVTGTHKLKIGATAGTVKVQWAQATSHATLTRLFADSYLRVHKVKA